MTARPALIRSKEDGQSVLGAWAFCAVYCSIAFFLFYVFAFQAGEVMGALISGFFAIFGVVYLVMTVRHTMDQWKFGVVNIALDGAPPKLGGELAGRILLPSQAAEAITICAELRCLKVVLGTDSKGNATKREDRAWFSEKFFRVKRSGARAEAEFRFAIPDGPEIPRDHETIWEIGIKAELPGVDLSRTFIIPVVQAVRSLGEVAATVALPKEGGFSPAQAFAMPRAVPAIGLTSASAPATANPQGFAPAQPRAPAAAVVDPSGLLPQEDAPMRSAWALVAANLVPIAGVIFLGWRVADVVVLYWVENIVIGVMNVARMLCARPDKLVNEGRSGTGARPGELMAAKLMLSGFFIAHFGAFCAGHGVFLASMFGARGTDLGMGGLLPLLAHPAMMVAVAALLASHLYSFWRNYIGREEYRHVDIASLMMRPYGRIVVVHLFIIVGGIVLMTLANQLLPMLLFVGLKIAIDLHMHKRERRLLALPVS